MAITAAFRSAVEAGDVESLRIMMTNSLYIDLTFNRFVEMENHVKGVPGLYDALYEMRDGRDLIVQESAWNDDYMNKVMVAAIGNFSHERVEHLKKVIKHLRPSVATSNSRPEAAGGAAQSEGRRNYRETYRRDLKMDRVIFTRKAKIVSGGVVGAVVGGTVVAAGASVFAGAVVGAIVVGGAVALATHEKTGDN